LFSASSQSERELAADGRIRLEDRRAAHIVRVLKVQPGQTLRMGVPNGPAGAGVIEEAAAGRVVLRWIPDPAPPALPEVDLLLALPRPKVLRRLWAPLASIGVGRIVLTNAARVERNYFDTHWLAADVYRTPLIEGLEQAGDTRLPEVLIRRRLKPLVEDELDRLHLRGPRVLAQPGDFPPLACAAADRPGRLLPAVGPEGGWTAYEIGLLREHRFVCVSAGPRTLRSDVACIALLAIAHEALRRRND